MAITQSNQSGTATLVQVSQLYFPVLDLVVEALHRRQVRRSFGRMTDAQLHDIGLTPLDVVAALSLPLADDARHALAKAAAKEAARW